MIAVSDIFDALGGPATIARELRIKPSTASEMKRRGSIPAEYWAELALVAERRRHPEINANLLAALHARRNQPDMSEAIAPSKQPGAERVPDLKEASSSHFGRFKHLRQTRFRTQEEINDHIRALRDEWNRR